jgi:tetratricopeptide (TPR) repeat protein
MNDALIHFRKAGRLDTDLWYGYVGMAESYVGLLLLTGRTDPEWMQWARDAAGRAVQLAPRVAVVHAAAGDVRLIADWDWNGAERSLETALQCNAFNYTAYQRRGILRTLQGRFEEARQDLRKARELQPEHSDAQVFSAWAEFCARDFDRAITLLDSLPANPGKRRQSLRVLAAAYGMKDDFRQARQALQNAGLPALDELTLRTWLDAREGKSEAARSGLVQLRALCNKEKLRYCDTAIIDAALGDSGSAFASLDQGIEQRHWSMLMVPVDPRLEPLRSDPRWQSICTRIRNVESQTALRR